MHSKGETSCLLGRVIANQINSLRPDLAPDVHVVAQIDGTADPVTGGPDELKAHRHPPRAKGYEHRKKKKNLLQQELK